MAYWSRGPHLYRWHLAENPLVDFSPRLDGIRMREKRMSILEANPEIAIEAAAAAYHSQPYSTSWLDLTIETRQERIAAMRVAVRYITARV